MFSPQGIFGAFLVLAGICQGDLDRSRLAPLSIVYTVYPYYKSESLLGIWKPEEPLQVSANLFALRGTPEKQATRNSAEAASNDESSSDSDTRDSDRINSKESTHSSEEHAAEITYWPPVQRGAAPKPRPARAI